MLLDVVRVSTDVYGSYFKVEYENSLGTTALKRVTNPSPIPFPHLSYAIAQPNVSYIADGSPSGFACPQASFDAIIGPSTYLMGAAKSTTSYQDPCEVEY